MLSDNFAAAHCLKQRLWRETVTFHACGFDGRRLHRVSTALLRYQRFQRGTIWCCPLCFGGSHWHRVVATQIS